MDIPERRCDLVMKGGITSGVVYPLAIVELSEEFRFQNIGGTSAGAIAAALTAAAEYRRRGTGGSRDGFDVLARLPAFLGGKTDGQPNLLGLFPPRREARGLFGVVLAFLGHRPLALKLARALGALIRTEPLGALVAVLLALVPFVSQRPAVSPAMAAAFALQVGIGLVAGLVLM